MLSSSPGSVTFTHESRRPQAGSGRAVLSDGQVEPPGCLRGMVPRLNHQYALFSGRRPATVRATTWSRQRPAPTASNSAAGRTSPFRESASSPARSTPVPPRRTTRSTASRPSTSPTLGGRRRATDLWTPHIEDTGIIIRGSNNILENSEIGFSAGNGVLLQGNNASLAAGNVVTNNLIHDVDYMCLD